LLANQIRDLGAAGETGWEDQLRVLALECGRCKRLAYPISTEPGSYRCPSCDLKFQGGLHRSPEPPLPAIGHIRVLGAVGRWQRGWWYRARDERLGYVVRVKTLSDEAAHDAGARARFISEARLSAALNHPNVITIYEFGESQGVPYMVFESLDGASLRQCMDAGISLERGLSVLLQSLEGLAAVHRCGIVLRDITPESIFVCRDGRVKLMDFWLAAIVPVGDRARPGSQAGLLFGQLSQLSPELVLTSPFDHRSDLFSLGCLLYEVVAGHKPFSGDTPIDLVHQIVDAEPSMQAIPSGPEWRRLRAVISRSLEKKAEDRYQDAKAMQEDLRAASSDLGAHASWLPPRAEDTRRPME
jgi:serine/threonine-protein kinase